MKAKIFFTIIPIFILGYTSFAQQSRGWEEKKELIKSEKIAFFTEELQLTPEEAEKFWPIYNDYENRKDKIHEQRRLDSKFIYANIDNLEEKELEGYANKFIEYQKKLSALSEEYHEKFKTVLSSRKIIRLYQAEHQFKGHLLRRIRHGKKIDRGEYFEN